MCVFLFKIQVAILYNSDFYQATNLTMYRDSSKHFTVSFLSVTEWNQRLQYILCLKRATQHKRKPKYDRRTQIKKKLLN